MREHVRATAPEEACGLLAGTGEVVSRVMAITNSLRSPVRYRMDAQEQLEALLWMEDHAQELLAIYHSHPCGPAHPSPTDIEEFAYPPALTLIWSPVGEDWQVRAFTIEDGQAQEMELRVQP